MSNSYFQFKQFIVYHDVCAMKVGTDGVLLGAWTDCEYAETILDIGTGSGLIALMLAQRSSAKMDAIEIDKNAFEQAKINVEQSPFRERINVFHSALQDFKPLVKYDRIVCNPPFFSNSLRPPAENRAVARHSDALTMEELLKWTSSMLSDAGSISLIIPFDNFKKLNDRALSYSLFLSRQTMVFPKPDVPAKRVLVEYSLKESNCQRDELVIEISRHNYSEKYKELTRDFYLKL